MKRGSRLKVSFFDENHLVEKAGFRFSWWRFALVCVAFSLVFMAIGMGIIWFTPLKNKLPGYMQAEQRTDTETAVLRLDSLESVYRINQAYIDNVAAILDTDREPVVEEDTLSAALPLELDSLLVPSAIEQEFVRKMEGLGYVIAAFDNLQSNDSIRQR